MSCRHDRYALRRWPGYSHLNDAALRISRLFAYSVNQAVAEDELRRIRSNNDRLIDHQRATEREKESERH